MDKILARAKEVLDILGMFWCRFTHRDILILRLDSCYRCETCMRRYALPWSDRVADGVWRKV